LGVFYMLSQGYSIDQIMSDTPEIRAAKQDAGAKVHQMLVDKDINALQDISVKGAEALAGEKMPAMDWRDPMQVAEHGNKVRFMGECAKDFAQIYQNQQGAMESRYGSKHYNRVLDDMEKVSKVSQCVGQIQRFYASDAYTINAKDYARLSASAEKARRSASAERERDRLSNIDTAISRGAPGMMMLDEYGSQIMGHKFNEMTVNPMEFFARMIELSTEAVQDGVDRMKQADDMRRRKPAAPAAGQDTPAQAPTQNQRVAAPQPGTPARQAISFNDLNREQQRTGPTRQREPKSPQLAAPVAGASQNAPRKRK
jgi:RES domain-containing protein